MSKKVRIELRYDAMKDKDIIDFIDRNGSTRAGFIKSLILQYKNAMEANTIPFNQIDQSPVQPKESPKKSDTSIEENKNPDKQKTNKKKIPLLGPSYSSKDLN